MSPSWFSERYNSQQVSVVLVIEGAVYQNLSSPSNLQNTNMQILSLCIEHVQHSYDLVLYADLVMQKKDVADDDRISKLVCNEMSKVRRLHSFEPLGPIEPT